MDYGCGALVEITLFPDFFQMFPDSLFEQCFLVLCYRMTCSHFLKLASVDVFSLDETSFSLEDYGTCRCLRHKNTPPERKTLGTFSLKHSKSGAGEQLLPLVCMAKARVNRVVFLQTPVSIHKQLAARAPPPCQGHGNHLGRNHVGRFMRTGCTGMLVQVHGLHH